MPSRALDVRVKRVYEPVAKDDGVRVLVDRLWPRGLSKGASVVDRWLRDVAPSTGLRQWYRHDPEKWTEFQRRYRAELQRATELVAELRSMARTGRVTLLFSSREPVFNNAVALQAVVRQSLPTRTPATRRPKSKAR